MSPGYKRALGDTLWLLGASGSIPRNPCCGPRNTYSTPRIHLSLGGSAKGPGHDGSWSQELQLSLLGEHIPIQNLALLGAD
jgi:hypothetical protein